MSKSTELVELDPEDPQATVCGQCGRAWDNDVATSGPGYFTPTPGGRCPFEYEHEYDEEYDEETVSISSLPTFPSAEELLSLSVICQGQVHDLHLQNHWTPEFSGVRFWVSRCGIEDGEPYETTVYVEVREWIPGNPSWYDLGHYDGNNPVESLAGYSPSDLGCGRGLLSF